MNGARLAAVVAFLMSLAGAPGAQARRTTAVRSRGAHSGAGARTHVARPRGTRGAKTRFFDFDDLLIDGEFRKPATLYTRAMRSPRFDRLLRLQKSFLHILVQSLRDPSLRGYR